MQIDYVLKTASSYFVHIGWYHPWLCWLYQWLGSNNGQQGVFYWAYWILMLRLEGLWQCLGLWRGCRLSLRTLILLRPFMFSLCARNLNTPVVCGSLSMAHTSIELSVCRKSSQGMDCVVWGRRTCSIFLYTWTDSRWFVSRHMPKDVLMHASCLFLIFCMVGWFRQICCLWFT
jgi:hypothetical protein